MCINHKGISVRKIARRQLSSIAHALGVTVLDDTDQLAGQMLLVRLKVRPAANGYDASNDVAGYAAIDSDADTKDAEAAPKEEPISGARKRSWK